jgi:EAL domain-containing protein (putative c-di-GMP-specific phosphodiesterase class I)
MGVDYGQGFAIARPVPFADVLAQLPLLAAAAPVAVNDDTHAGLLAANLH